MNMVIIDLTMMITCMPIFSNCFWISILSQNFPPWHKFHFVKTVHAILKGAISLAKWPWSKLSYLANQSASKNNMDLPFYDPNYRWYHVITIEHICFKCNILDCIIQMIYYDQCSTFFHCNNKHCRNWSKWNLLFKQFDNKQLR
jgi:hypothetical protein